MLLMLLPILSKALPPIMIPLLKRLVHLLQEVLCLSELAAAAAAAASGMSQQHRWTQQQQQRQHRPSADGAQPVLLLG
jgi:hypothetical protein